MKTLIHLVFAITLLVGTTLFANNDAIVNDKTSDCQQESTQLLLAPNFSVHENTIEDYDSQIKVLKGLKDKASTTCEEFEDLKFEDVCPDVEEIGDFGFIDIAEMELLSEEMEALGFEDVCPEDQEIGDFGFVDIEEMELLREEMEALEFKLSKKTYSKVLK